MNYDSEGLGDLGDLRVITSSSMKLICRILFDYENRIIVVIDENDIFIFFK